MNTIRANTWTARGDSRLSTIRRMGLAWTSLDGDTSTGLNTFIQVWKLCVSQISRILAPHFFAAMRYRILLFDILMHLRVRAFFYMLIIFNADLCIRVSFSRPSIFLTSSFESNDIAAHRAFRFYNRTPCRVARFSKRVNNTFFQTGNVGTSLEKGLNHSSKRGPRTNLHSFQRAKKTYLHDRG